MTTTLPTGTLDERPQAVKAIRVYFRQSRDQEEQRESIATQRAECTRLALMLGVSGRWRDRVEYIDVDRSGDDFAGREELQRLIRETQPGDLVLAWKQDRLGRDMIDSAATIRELVKYRRCTLHTVETGTMPVTLDSAEQTAMVMLRGMSAQAELERIRSRTRDGLRQRARDGFATGHVPFGFRRVLVDPTVADRKQSKKRIEIDETKAPLVRRIFEMYADGRGYATIAKALNREGVLSPKGRGWAPSSIWTMLRETRYAGEWTHGRRRVVKREGGRVIMANAPEHDVVRVQRPELAIIPPDLWARVQAALAARRVEDMKAQLVASRWASVHVLSGTLKCGDCGGPMRVHNCQSRTTDWSQRYYHCGVRRSGRCASSAWLPAEQVEQPLIEHVRSIVLPQIEDTIRQAIDDEVRNVVATANARASEAEELPTIHDPER
jgi:site-specific DNA recombinase